MGVLKSGFGLRLAWAPANIGIFRAGRPVQPQFWVLQPLHTSHLKKKLKYSYLGTVKLIKTIKDKDGKKNIPTPVS